MEILKTMRKNRKLTLKQAGLLVGTAPNNLSVYESGSRKLYDKTIEKIATAYKYKIVHDAENLIISFVENWEESDFEKFCKYSSRLEYLKNLEDFQGHRTRQLTDKEVKERDKLEALTQLYFYCPKHLQNLKELYAETDI